MDNNKITLRPEEPKDYRAVENITREAFWNHHGPGCNEHYLMHIIRDKDCFLPALSIVAEHGGELIGHIAYTKATILGDDGVPHEVVSFGPISVLPACQKQGIGRLLIEHSRVLAGKMGFDAIFIYGDPAYYSRFGFEPAETYGIATPDEMYADALQCFFLKEGALHGITGRFFEDPSFDMDDAAAEAFDQIFPLKEKKSGLPSQERFQMLIQLRKPRK